MTYGGYLQLDRILDAQAPRSGTHDEMLFVIIHQVKELWMKLMLHELEAALVHLARRQLRPAFKMLARFKRIQEQLISAWSVLTTMTPADYSRFRDALGQSSGFQSYQYRSIEFILGNKQPAMLKPHAHDAAVHGRLKALIERPSLYDEAIALIEPPRFRHRRRVAGPGLDRAATSSTSSVHDAWLKIYRDPEQHWDLYEAGGEPARHRGPVRDLALPPRKHGGAGDRHEDRHRRHLRRAVSAPSDRHPHLHRALGGADRGVKKLPASRLAG